MFSRKGGLGGFSPRNDISDTDKEFQITVELPGVNEKDLEVSVYQ